MAQQVVRRGVEGVRGVQQELAEHGRRDERPAHRQPLCGATPVRSSPPAVLGGRLRTFFHTAKIKKIGIEIKSGIKKFGIKKKLESKNRKFAQTRKST